MSQVTITYCGIEASGRNVTEANARLIEAAPDLLAWLVDAADHLRQYHAYSEAMREKGLGFEPSSQFSPAYLLGAIEATIAKATGEGIYQRATV